MIINSFNQNPYKNKLQQPNFGLTPKYLFNKAGVALNAAIKTEQSDKMLKYLIQNNRLVDGAVLREERQRTGSTFKEARKAIDKLYARKAKQIELAKTIKAEDIQRAEQVRKAPVRTFLKELGGTFKLAVKNMFGEGKEL
ncbi:MAG TPA: hypothetical protein P5556_03815 [Candidatus Gastranaerophilales bacterium]|nr:hypothetical protein [Candidatus Gastranaerophilales bacterium]